jgi:hypothetical protein
MIPEDRVWRLLRDCLAMRRQKRVASGWINICCPVCGDRRFRCGVINDGNRTVVSCFNCGLKTGFRLGQRLGQEMRQFLTGLGMAERDIAHLGYWADQVRQVIVDDPHLQQTLGVTVTPMFATAALPDGSRSLWDWGDDGCTEADFEATVSYLLSRGEAAACATTYYWTPRHDLRRHLIIPCYLETRIVGWVARAIDPVPQRYHRQAPSNYLFNANFLQGERRYVPIVEGVFDALTIDGVAALGATLTPQQIAWINQSGKRPVVLPDRDAAGRQLIEIAISQEWPVANPLYGRYQWWEHDVKDAAQAVQRYGKLYVLQSILATQETHPGLIRMRASYLMG